MGTTLGIGSSQLGQPNPWGPWPYGAQTIGAQPFNQLQYSQPPNPMSFAGYGVGNNPSLAQTQYAQPLQQIQQLLNVLLYVLVSADGTINRHRRLIVTRKPIASTAISRWRLGELRGAFTPFPRL